MVVVAESLSSSWPPLRLIVCGALNALASKAIVSAPGVEFAWETAQRRLPGLVLSSVLVTLNVDGTHRSSSASTPRRLLRGILRIGRVMGPRNNGRSQEGIVMKTPDTGVKTDRSLVGRKEGEQASCRRQGADRL